MKPSQCSDMGSAGDGSTMEDETRAQASLLTLPVEIRLQIYHWVYLMSPILQRDLAPFLPAIKHSAYYVRRVVTAGDEDWPPTRTRPPLRPDRPYSHMPSALLQSCRQVYDEARRVPFAGNEFVFPVWFTSGVEAARAVTRALQPWQADALRWVRLEVLERHLVTGRWSSPDAEEYKRGDADRSRPARWAELCGLWAGGVRGLRLQIRARGPGEGTDTGNSSSSSSSSSSAGGQLTRKEGEEEEEGATDGDGDGDGDGSAAAAAWSWVRDGLARMAALRTLEVELDDADRSAADKIAWCRRLGEELGREGRADVEVVCMEKDPGVVVVV